MTNTEWNKAIEWLLNGEEGAYVEDDKTGRWVEVANMCGGKYMLYTGKEPVGDFGELTDDIDLAMLFLQGTYIGYGKFAN